MDIRNCADKLGKDPLDLLERQLAMANEVAVQLIPCRM